MVLMMENESYADIIGNAAAPYQNELADHYETATDSYGVGHDSLDNYLAVLSGQFFSWSTGDCTPGPRCQSYDSTLISQLDNAHVAWLAFMGSMPQTCDKHNADNGTAAQSYVVRHDPFVYFPRLVQYDCARVEAASAMLSSLDAPAPPNFVWLSPDACQDAGKDEPCATIANGDAYLAKEIPAIQATRWYGEGGVIVLTYDEGDGSGQGKGEYLQGSGNHVLTVVISAATERQAPDTSYVNHFGLLAGIERLYGLPCLQNACAPSNGVLELPSGMP